jgi:hypothetical protein
VGNHLPADVKRKPRLESLSAYEMIANRKIRYVVEARLETTIQTEINPAARHLSGRLLAVEDEAGTIAAEDALATCRVCEKLRRPLSNLVGRAAFTSLLQRALTLAKRESPALGGVEVMDDGSLSGFERAATASRPVLIAHLIQLLITFIGEGLTLTLLRDIWPELKGLDEPLGKAGHDR